MAEKLINPLHDVIHQTFDKSAIKDLEANYLQQVNNITKWTCFTDYCLDDDNKPNDVCSFTLIPYIDDHQKLVDYISSVAKADIKNTKYVTDEFTSFLKEYPLINFSIIINNRKKLFGADADEVSKSLKQTFEDIKKQYLSWGEHQPGQKEMYAGMIKKLNCVLHLIDTDKKIKQIINMLLVTHIGAYLASRVVNRDILEVFGWFSDRDAINEVCDQVSIDLFFYFLFGFTKGADFRMVSASATSTDKPFYDGLVRLPDYIAGTLADYNMETGLISKEKFDIVLTNYMAENLHNNFVFNVGTTAEGALSCSRVKIHKKDDEHDK